MEEFISLVKNKNKKLSNVATNIDECIPNNGREKKKEFSEKVDKVNFEYKGGFSRDMKFSKFANRNDFKENHLQALETNEIEEGRFQEEDNFVEKENFDENDNSSSTNSNDLYEQEDELFFSKEVKNDNNRNFNNNNNFTPRKILTNSSETKSMACFKFARTGFCEKGERCNYSHDKDLCKVEWRRQQEEAMKSPFAENRDQTAFDKKRN